MAPFHFLHRIRVRYGETDQMGVCWHGNYLLYLEEARGEAIRHACGSYADIEAAGVITPVVAVDLRYHHPAHYDELLDIHVYVDEPPRATIRFRYEIRNPQGDLVLDGTTDLAFVDKVSGRPCRPPLPMRQAFKQP